MDADQDLFFPEITLPPKETDLVVDRYAQANIVLEYGSGGSTIIGAECESMSLLMSVESDQNWADQLRKTITSLYPDKNIKLHHADIGPTKEWGYPIEKQVDEISIRYAQSIWEQDYFEHPDLIMIDGRYRVGCFFTSLLNIQKPITVLWDDYIKRKHYHIVEKYFMPTQMEGRMAVFHIEPKTYTSDDLAYFKAHMILPE